MPYTLKNTIAIILEEDIDALFDRFFKEDDTPPRLTDYDEDIAYDSAFDIFNKKEKPAEQYMYGYRPSWSRERREQPPGRIIFTTK